MRDLVCLLGHVVVCAVVLGYVHNMRTLLQTMADPRFSEGYAKTTDDLERGRTARKLRRDPSHPPLPRPRLPRMGDRVDGPRPVAPHSLPARAASCLHAAALWRLRRAGMRTVLVGATGIDDARDVAAPSDRLADPTARLERDWGIDVCPVHASYPDVWCAGVHDERALQEAADALARHTGDTPLFVCVHSRLSRRGASALRRDGRDGSDGAAADEDVDARIAPSPWRPATRPSSRRIPPHRPSTSPWPAATEALRRTHAAVARLVGDVLDRGGHAAVTATHSPALGEHGVRGEATVPLAATSLSFGAPRSPVSVWDGRPPSTGGATLSGAPAGGRARDRARAAPRDPRRRRVVSRPAEASRPRLRVLGRHHALTR